MSSVDEIRHETPSEEATRIEDEFCLFVDSLRLARENHNAGQTTLDDSLLEYVTTQSSAVVQGASDFNRIDESLQRMRSARAQFIASLRLPTFFDSNLLLEYTSCHKLKYLDGYTNQGPEMLLRYFRMRLMAMNQHIANAFRNSCITDLVNDENLLIASPLSTGASDISCVQQCISESGETCFQLAIPVVDRIKGSQYPGKHAKFITPVSNPEKIMFVDDSITVHKTTYRKVMRLLGSAAFVL